MSRSKRTLIAKETVQIVEQGCYLMDGKSVCIAEAVSRSKKRTVHYRPVDFDVLRKQRQQMLSERARCSTSIRVANQTTLAGARDLLSESESPVLCLNFASAKNPGGGFLSGSQAQEESLARASALYHCIHDQRGYYDVNRACGTCLYTDHMIYSPDVPVFRDDDDQLISDPYVISIVTSPAVNLGALLNNHPDEADQVPEIMAARIEKVLSLAVSRGYDSLVLGAWGCGVFRNDPKSVASWFANALNGDFAGAFQRITFAVLDHTKDLACFTAFDEQLSP